MFTLSDDTQVQAESAWSKPVLLVRISISENEWLYADRDLSGTVSATGRIVSCDPIRMLSDDTGAESTRSWSITLADADGTLQSLLEDGSLQQATVTLLQGFYGLSLDDAVPIASGAADAGSILWSEADRTLTLSVRDPDVLFRDQPLCRTATRDVFDSLPSESEGKYLPRALGRPRRISPLLVQTGSSTELMFACTTSADQLALRDGSVFSSGEITVCVNNEYMSGTVSGDVFEISARDVSLYSGTFGSQTGNRRCLQTSGLTHSCDDEFAGLILRAEIADVEQKRTIISSGADTGTLWVNSAFTTEDGTGWPPEETAFTIGGTLGQHAAGSTVREVVDEHLYLVSDRPVRTLGQVEAWGIVRDESSFLDFDIVKQQEGWFPLPDSYYEFRPSVTLENDDHSVAVLALRLLPEEITEFSITSNELAVTVEGEYDDDDALIENPADVIRHFLCDDGGVDEELIDDDSFTAAQTARSDVPFSFVLQSGITLLTAVRELALQAQLSLAWENGKFYLRELSNALADPAAELSEDVIVQDCLQLGLSEPESLTTSIAARYTDSGESKSVTITDDDAQDLYGASSKTMSFWGYDRRHLVTQSAAWWLRRLRHRYRTIRLDAFLPALNLQRRDVVSLTHSALGETAVVGEVRQIIRTPADFENGIPTTARITIQTPAWPGCVDTCETVCESGSCETSCELSCTTTSETSCAWSCESEMQVFSFTTQGRSCKQTCETSCRTDEQSDGSCTTTCETTCQLSCEGQGCEAACETTCETTCETAEQTSSPVRQVQVVTAPSAAYGSATVVTCDTSGNVGDVSFSAVDVFDLNPASGDILSAILNARKQWILVPGSRNVKYVKILSGSGPYTVIEQDADGNTRGSSFSASAPASE